MTQTSTATQMTRQQLTANLATAEAFGYTDLATANRRLLAKLDAKETPVASTEDRIIAAVKALGAGNRVSLVRVRAAVADIPRAEQDRALKALHRARIVLLEGEPNRKTLPADAADWALRVGPEDTHLISMF